MKYLLLIHSNPANWAALSPAERDGLMSEYFAFTKEIVDSGEFVSGSQLADATQAQVVRVRGGGTQVVDGPFAESKEQLAGFYLVECDSPKRGRAGLAHPGRAVQRRRGSAAAGQRRSGDVSTSLEGLLRELAPQALGAILRREPGDFGAAEDAVQEALLAAALRWPEDGVPENPRAWLVTVAARRLVDWQRRESARRPKEAAAVDWLPVGDQRVAGPEITAADDSLVLLFLCCHPSLPHSAQVSLTLRAVGGLSTAEIARAYLVPEATMARRIGRAKKRIADTGLRFELPGADSFADRLAAVLEALYLIFNEGYTASSGAELHRAELTGEAIRLARQLHRQLPDEGEVAGLLALMLLTDARRGARVDAGGRLVPLSEQDRTLWDLEQITEGSSLIESALKAHPVGPYQLQAAIAAVHDEAHEAEDTDWTQIVSLYRILDRIAPSPVVTLNMAVSVGMADGPLAGLAVLDTLDDEPHLAHHHRLAAVRAHLLELAGDRVAARTYYEQAARTTASVPERTYLLARAARLG
jgi:RNA polymerase sigma factor (sigma-70 family)